MNVLRAHKTGLTLGGVLAVLHGIWVLAVLLGAGQPFLDWIFGLHFLSNPYRVLPFGVGSAVMLLLINFIAGYISGWLWAVFASAVHRGQR